jgi:DNA-directed RNA polymerase specialized sigma24 family protein
MIVSGLTQEETARQLNTTTKAIEMRIRRARKKLTQTLTGVPK